ncbi:HAD family phosphatase [Diaphorobacter sp. HDW4A]|uniref:HAD family hydrolase n=1 Tax=Diaphorobacter sp. HDW4A TaxID=2714924 RepID=UPI00140A7949|nr:HAD family phosphatase [Diaphorobacter sp. HDW4A]QIL83268.1 HAD family phosphatase [Diaphorobacter sp. HDW4A]
MTAKFDAVLFDCDGVLVDSESITNRVLRDMLNEAGWPITTEECLQQFIGKTVRSQAALIESHTGKPFTEEWLQQFYVRRNEALNAELVAIDGALAAVENVHAALKGRIACASGADRAKVEMQLAKVGLAPFFEGRVFSGHETPRSKPFPDVYLAAAAALDVDPKRCLVIEDTLTGVQAGVAAGATVWAYFPSHQGHADASDLVNAGASRVFDAMGDLPRLMAEAA